MPLEESFPVHAAEDDRVLWLFPVRPLAVDVQPLFDEDGNKCSEKTEDETRELECVDGDDYVG
jgi:hypothetical protein